MPQHYVSVARTSLAVQRRGSGSPVLVIHGGGEDADMLAKQAESLAAAGFEVITYDLAAPGALVARTGPEAVPTSTPTTPLACCKRSASVPPSSWASVRVE